MKQSLIFFGRQALLWIFFYILTKGIFLVYHADLSQTLNFAEIAKVFLYGLRMDVSATGYMLLIPGLLMVLIPFINQTVFVILNKIYFVLMSLFVTFITIVDYELYRHWGFRLDLTPLNYIDNGAMSSTPWSTTLLLVAFWLALFAVLYYCYHRFVVGKYNHLKGRWFHAPIYLFITGSMILPIRGSLDIGPMNLGFVYFHKEKPFANHSAINVFWNIGNAIYKASDADKYPENFVNRDTAKGDFNKLYAQNNLSDTLKVLKMQRPNILLIVLEGFTAKMIVPLGGDESITPNFNRLSKEGILFENYYASGDRTDKGLISVLSGYPAQTKTSIIKYAGKTEKLPKVNLDLKAQGYQTSFVYGGDVNFANMNSYLNMSGFEEVIKKSYFNAAQGTNKWGVHDHIVFDTLLNLLQRQQPPFFTTMLTLSSHEPFDVPMETVIEGSSSESKFLNSAHYTDRSLGDFVDSAKKSGWWDNTLIVLLADHGNRHPNKSPNYVPERFHIPMLWLGGALIVQDTIISTYGSQTDLAATLFNQLDLDAKRYPYSRDILSNMDDGFAIYIYNDGFGYVDPTSEAIYDLGGAQVTRLKGDSSKLGLGKSYIQTIYSDFNGK